MYFTTNAVTLCALLFTTLSTAEGPMPYILKRGSISFNDAFGLGGLSKRQAGYQPTQTQCGPGADCAASCGAGYVQCASNDGNMHCYAPPNGESCCTDGTGNSCQAGYFCTDDNLGNTWCCPNGMDLASCAALYSISGGLSSISTAAPSSIPPASVTVSASTTTTHSVPTYTATVVSSSSSNNVTSKASLAQYTPTMVASTLPASTSAVQFTGAGEKLRVAGLMLVGAMGVGLIF